MLLHSFGEFIVGGASIPCGICYIIDSLAKNITNSPLILHQYYILEFTSCLGIFMYWEKGEDFNDAPLEYSKAYIDLVYLNGIRSK